MIRLRTTLCEFGIGPTHPVAKGANPPRGANVYFSFWYAYKTNSKELLITYVGQISYLAIYDNNLI